MPADATLLAEFIAMERELGTFKNGKAVTVDGQTLSIAAITATARYQARVELDDSPTIKERVAKSRQVVLNKIEAAASVYGLSTGYGGSADTRTDKPLLLGHALLQHLHVGILPSSTRTLNVLPLQDPMSTSMPESWVRGAMLLRMNSLIRGHSGIRWELLEKINELLSANITPFVPLRGSVSASGDICPLSYLAGALVANPTIRVFHGPAKFGARQISSSSEILKEHKITPLPLAAKESLGILNGTSFAAAVASLAMYDAVHLALLSQVCTAMMAEAVRGARGSFHPFLHKVARPHPGQVECADNIFNLLDDSKFARLHDEEVSLDSDRYSLRQDRYTLRTVPQFLGPQIDDIMASYHTMTRECNSTTDNPLFDAETGEVHHGGNFQAMAVSNAMEKTRLALHHLGKLLFAQGTELLNPTMNNGLPPSLAATDPSLNYHAKGVDTALAAYVSELGHLAGPVTTHMQSAEMHNQAINSLALISARATINSVEVLMNLAASCLYLLCQAFDIRAFQAELSAGLYAILGGELAAISGSSLSVAQQEGLVKEIHKSVLATLDKTTSMDVVDRMDAVASSTTSVVVNYLGNPERSSVSFSVSSIFQFRSKVAARGVEFYQQLTGAFLSGGRGWAPASPYLNKSKPIYEFVRLNLGIRMHGSENYALFANGLGVENETIGQNISLIYEAIRDGKIQSTVISLFA